MLDMTLDEATDVLIRARRASETVTMAPAVAAVVGNDIEDALDVLQKILARVEEQESVGDVVMADGQPQDVDVVSVFEIEGRAFGIGKVTRLNGHVVRGVQKFVVTQTDGDWSQVVLTLGGCQVVTDR